MTTTREQRADVLERLADDVADDDLVESKTAALRTIVELVEQRVDVDTAFRDAREADRSWSEIGAMLGASTQAAQSKYAAKISA